MKMKNQNIKDNENNPLYLKSKADEFLKNKDYYSAINAYNSALEYCHISYFRL